MAHNWQNWKGGFESKNSFAHVTHITVIIFHTAKFVYIKLMFRNTDFPSRVFVFSAKVRFLKQMLLKKANTRSLFLCKTTGTNNYFTLIKKKKNQAEICKIAKFEFNVTEHYGLWQNESSCDPLNEKWRVMWTDFASQDNRMYGRF